MGLNIKNEETHRLAAQLADLTGETMTGAVTQAIRERIERLQRARNSEQIIQLAQALIQRSGGENHSLITPASMMTGDSPTGLIGLAQCMR